MTPINLEDSEAYMKKRAIDVREGFIKVDLIPFIRQCFVELRAREAAVIAGP